MKSPRAQVQHKKIVSNPTSSALVAPAPKVPKNIVKKDKTAIKVKNSTHKLKKSVNRDQKKNDQALKTRKIISEPIKKNEDNTSK